MVSAASAIGRLGSHADEEQRDAVEDEAGGEVVRKPHARGEHEGHPSTDQAADAHRGVEPADGRCPSVEKIEGGHDDEDSESPVDERLRGEQRPAASRARGSGPRAESRPLCRPRRVAPLAPSAASATGSATRIPTISAADQTKLAALTAKTTSGLVATSSRPPSAGPANAPTPSSVLDATFAAVSSAGVRASTGSNAACAGRNGVPAAVDTPTIAYTSQARPVERDHGGGRPHQTGAHRGRSRPSRSPRYPVRERRQERRKDRGRDHADHGDDPDSARTTLLEGVDGQRDRVRPRAEDRARPGELQASSVRDSGTSRRAACRAAASRARRPCTRRASHIRGKPCADAGRFQPIDRLVVERRVPRGNRKPRRRPRDVRRA